MPIRALSSDRLLPCLLDRLTDDKPYVKKKENYQGTSLTEYRDSVCRDLEWLLNTGSYLKEEEISDLDEAKKSLLNYGIKSYSGIFGSSQTEEEMKDQIHAAIVTFEPRIIADTLEIQLVPKEEKTGDKSTTEVGKFHLEIRGELWLQPIPEPFTVATAIDLGTGTCTLELM